jgi:hypothetical protein
MNYGSRYLGSCAESGEDGVVKFDWNEFIKGILLFDTFVLESMRLREFPHLIERFGVDGVCSLLSTGSVELVAEAVSIGEITGSQRPHTNVFKCNVIRMSSQKEYVHRCLEVVRELEGLSKRENQAVRKAIATAVKDTPADYRCKSLRQMNHFLEFNPAMIAPALSAAAARWEGATLSKDRFSIRTEPRGDDRFFVDFEHPDARSLSSEQKQNIIRRGILGSVDLDVRFEAMERHRAVPVISPDDIALVDDRMSLLLSNLPSSGQLQRFERLERIIEFPDLSGAIESGKLDFERLLKIRDSDECREFRRWLVNMDGKSDAEISELFTSIRARIASGLGTGTGKAIRFLATNALGLIDAGTGLLSGAVDTFLLNKVFPNRGPLVFVNTLYPSVFRDD